MIDEVFLKAKTFGLWASYSTRLFEGGKQTYSLRAESQDQALLQTGFSLDRDDSISGPHIIALCLR